VFVVTVFFTVVTLFSFYQYTAQTPLQ